MEMPSGSKVWFNGKIVDRSEAQIGLFSHVIHYGTGLFEGIRAYEQLDGSGAVFRLKEHLQRMHESAKILRLKLPYSVDQLITATEAVCAANQFKECYIRPVAFIGEGPLGVNPGDNPPVELAILVWKWGTYVSGSAKGARVCISSYQRPHVNTLMTKGKISGHYVNSVLAKREALENGYDEALLLDTDGFLSEGSGMNLFFVKEGIVKTTPLTSILNGITRNSVIDILRANGHKVVEERFTRDELYCADEVFLTGTAAEVTAVTEVDRRSIGWGSQESKTGPLTIWLQSYFRDVVRGKHEKYRSWLHPLTAK